MERSYSPEQMRLGHASAAFTMDVYGHLQAGMQRTGAEAYAKALSEES